MRGIKAGASGWEASTLPLSYAASPSKLFFETRIQSDTEKKIEWMNRSVLSKKKDIINLLIEAVVKIDPKVHQNYNPTEEN